MSKEQDLEFRDLGGEHLLEFVQGVAKENNCYITYAATREAKDGSWRNSAMIIDRQGQVAGIYNKNHVVITETTEGGVLCGADTPIIECDFGRVGLAICFDLNFDELRLKYKAAKPDLIVFPSMYHGGLMQSYWAYSCRAHFVGCISSISNPSEVYSPQGHKLAASTNYFNYVTTTINLDCKIAHLDFNQGKFIELKKKYGPGVTIFDPGQLGSVLITSELDDVTVDQMIEEFDIELLDDYFERSLAHHHDPKNIEPR